MASREPCGIPLLDMLPLVPVRRALAPAAVSVFSGGVHRDSRLPAGVRPAALSGSSWCWQQPDGSNAALHRLWPLRPLRSAGLAEPETVGTLSELLSLEEDFDG